jgi:lipoprotein NlpI
MQAAASAMDVAATAERFDHLLPLAQEFTSRYSAIPLGYAYLGVALTGTGQYDAAIAAIGHTVELGFDAMEGHTVRVTAFEGKGDVRGALQE